MSSLQRLVITSNTTALDFISQCNLKPLGQPAVNNMVDYFAGLVGGNVAGASLAWKVGCVKATGSITSAGTATANQTMKVANQTLTAKASGAVAANGEFNVSATVGTQATNIAAAINAVVALVGIVTASASLGVVTVTAVVPGLIGNGIELVDIDLGNVTVAGMAGGTDGTAYNISLA